MKWVFTPLLLLTVAVFLRADRVKTKSPQRKAATSSSKKTVSAKSNTSSHSRITHGRRRRARRAPAPAYQLHPDTSRYAEIQKALSDRGYFKGEANGQWNDDSVDALKRFQADQKLDSGGKIDSRTLIGLGLGPKHDASLAPPHLAPSSPPAETTPVTQAAPSSAPETRPAPAAPPN